MGRTRHGRRPKVPTYAAAGKQSEPAKTTDVGERPPGRWARMLDEAWVLGPDRLLAVCAVDNVASVKTIERRGGVFAGIRDTRV